MIWICVEFQSQTDTSGHDEYMSLIGIATVIMIYNNNTIVKENDWIDGVRMVVIKWQWKEICFKNIIPFELRL